MKKLLMLGLSMLLLSGCSWFDGNNTDNMNDPMNEPSNNDNQPDDNSSMNKSGKIQDVIDYFETEGVEVQNMSAIDQFDFAAHEGAMFELNGETVYLYRLNSTDAQMQNWMNEIKQNNTVSVNKDGMDEEYSALLNNDYLLVYNKDADIAPLDELFNNYSMK